MTSQCHISSISIGRSPEYFVDTAIARIILYCSIIRACYTRCSKSTRLFIRPETIVYRYFFYRILPRQTERWDKQNQQSQNIFLHYHTILNIVFTVGKSMLTATRALSFVASWHSTHKNSSISWNLPISR